MGQFLIVSHPDVLRALSRKEVRDKAIRISELKIIHLQCRELGQNCCDSSIYFLTNISSKERQESPPPLPLFNVVWV